MTVSVVIPIHNEEGILRGAITELVANLRSVEAAFEVLLAENGSWDGTLAVADSLASEFEEVSVFSVAEPNYGAALREGILLARGLFVICEEIDLCDLDFHRRALALLRQDAADIVVGSKRAASSHDRRPLGRRLATRVYNELLHRTLGFTGTDTHGLKVLRRDRVLPVLERCVVDGDVFASELLIRGDRMGLRVIELPVDIAEKRPPSTHLLRRVPSVLIRLARLSRALRET